MALHVLFVIGYVGVHFNCQQEEACLVFRVHMSWRNCENELFIPFQSGYNKRMDFLKIYFKKCLDDGSPVMFSVHLLIRRTVAFR